MEFDTIRPGGVDLSTEEEEEEVTAIDAGERKVTIGSIVQTLRFDYLKRELNSIKEESTILKIANKRAIVHDIVSEVNKVYIEVLGENVVGSVPASCVVLESPPTPVTLGDGTEACVGSFVKIRLMSNDKGEELTQGHWLHGMTETCGRTGKIVRVTSVGDILVQFAWGPRFYYKAKDLGRSHSKNIVTQDLSDCTKWIQVGSPVQVTECEENFVTSQQKRHLTSEHWPALVGQYVTIEKILIKAFSSSKTVQVSRSNCDDDGDVGAQQKWFSVHVDSVSLIDHVMDREGQMVRVPGDRVRLCRDEEEVKTVQKLWDPDIKNYLTLVGVSVQLGLFSSHLKVKVKFYDGKAFFLDPKLLTLHTDEDDKHIYSETIKPWTTIKPDSNSIISSATTLEIIDSDDLKCGDLLGEGSYGAVYRGHWHKNFSWHPVAIKKIELSIHVKANSVWTEADTQLSLNHPNIVRMYGIHEEIKELWVIMDLIDGTDLFTLLFENPDPDTKLEFEQKRKLSLDMCNAIAYIHQRKYTHCDIKPHNMMVDHQSGKLYICDFGITRFVGEATMNTIMMRFTKDMVGTPAYIAPECFQQDEVTEKFPTPTFASDVWALGIVFFELFTEQIFCEGGMKFLSWIMSNEDQLVKKRILHVPEDIRPIVARALNFEPRLRPTAQQLCEFFHELSFRRNCNK